MSVNSNISTASADMALRPSTSFQRFSTYSDTRKDTPMLFGDSGEVSFMFNSTRDVMVVDGQGHAVEVRGLNMGRDRYELVERFNRAPKLNADMASGTEATREVANVDFELLGTSAVSADTALYVESGFTLSTHGATNDSSIILPHLDTQQSAWATTTWGTDQLTRWEAVIQTPTAVTSCIIWAGLKLTNTPTLATDNDQAYFMLDTGAGADATKWHCIYSISGTDTDAAAANASVTIAAVAATTTYHLVVDIDSSRIARFYINGVLAGTSTALTTAVDLIPYIGIKDLSAGSARGLRVFKTAISRHSGA